MSEQEKAKKREEVIRWLVGDSEEKYTRKHRRGDGFSVSGRLKIQKKDGSVALLVDEMKSIGFADDVEAGGYRCRYQPADERYAESFGFFAVRQPVAAPEGLF